MSTILSDIKKVIGAEDFDDEFDVDILIYINGELSKLCQVAILNDSAIPIDKDTEWKKLSDDRKLLNLIRNYLSIKTKLEFDPPESSVVANTYDKLASEYEWRIGL